MTCDVAMAYMRIVILDKIYYFVVDFLFDIFL